MKKTFKAYLTIWFIGLVLFNIISFIIPSERKNNFFIGYIFITLEFLGQLFCTSIAFKAQNTKKFFYSFPLISLSFIGTAVMLIIGSVTMAVDVVPVWVGIVSCLIVLAFTAIAVINAEVAKEAVIGVDERVKGKTLFIKMLTAEALVLMSKAKTEETKEITKRVYEKIRYSDPVSSDALSSIESQITVRFKAFENSVYESSEKASLFGEELIVLIEDRNIKCKLLK